MGNGQRSGEAGNGSHKKEAIHLILELVKRSFRRTAERWPSRLIKRNREL
jgi:hypothetical protein